MFLSWQVRNMNAASSSPLYRAALEEMAGGLGSSKKRARAGGGFVILQGHKVPKSELEEEPSVYQLARLWMLNSSTVCDDAEPSIDIFNLPAAPLSIYRPALLTEDEKSSKRTAVDALVGDDSVQTPTVEELREQLLSRGKAARSRDVAGLQAVEALSSDRMQRFKEKLG